MDADGYFMLVQNMEQCQVSEESRSQWTMTIYGNASTKDITNYRLLVTHDRFRVTADHFARDRRNFLRFKLFNSSFYFLGDRPTAQTQGPY